MQRRSRMAPEWLVTPGSLKWSVSVSLWLCVTCVASEQLTVLFPLSSETMGCVLGVFNEIIYAKRRHSMNVCFSSYGWRESTEVLSELSFLLRRGTPGFLGFFPFLSNEGGSRLHVLLTDTWMWLTLLVSSTAADTGWSWLRAGGEGGQQIPFPCETLSTKGHYLSFRGKWGVGRCLKVSTGEWRMWAGLRLFTGSWSLLVIPLPQAGSIFPAPWDYGF